MKPRIEIFRRHEGAGFEFSLTGSAKPDWMIDEILREGDLFVDVATGRRFTLHFEEVVCVDC